VIDSFDRDRLHIAKNELMSLLEEDELKGLPVMVLANKQVQSISFNQDMQGALTVAEISEYLGLSTVMNRQWTMYVLDYRDSFKCSAYTGLGLGEAMEWLANVM
jgi:ADP-ribosylation factor-like protein 1